MARKSGAEAIYEAAALFRERCLKSGDSLLWPRDRAWKAENTKRLWDAVFGHPDTPKNSFFGKLKFQLSQEPEDVHRIAADLIAVYYLFPRDIGKEKKLENLKSVISWKLSSQQADLGPIERAYDTSIGSVGTAYQSSMPSQIQFLLEFVQGVQAGKADSESASSCKSLADEISSRISFGQAGRNVLLHLFFPDTFERIVSKGHKKAIVAAFSNLVAAEDDDDQALTNIRAKLAPEHGGSKFDFYLPDVQELWDLESNALPKKRKNAKVPAEKVGPRCWIEKTLVQGRSDRTSGQYALGQALWSPQLAKGGADVYRFMRETQPGDVVFHLTDNQAFTLVSRTASAVEEFSGIPGTEWGGRSVLLDPTPRRGLAAATDFPRDFLRPSVSGTATFAARFGGKESFL